MSLFNLAYLATLKITVLLCSLALLAPNVLFAQGTVYIEASLGQINAPDTIFQSSTNDLASICDEYINPNAPNIESCNIETTGPIEEGGWQSSYTGAGGLVGGVEFGFNISDKTRVALDFSRGASAIDQTVKSSNASGDDFEKLIGEIEIGEESIENANTQEVFIWFMGDLPIARNWTISGGLGLGLSRHSYELSWNWKRWDDPAEIETGTGQPNEDEIKKNLAGTASIGSAEISDRVFGFGLNGSVARSISPWTSIGIEASYRKFVEFQSSPYSGGTLRDHPSNLRLDGSHPVATWSDTLDTDRTNVELFVRRYF